MPRPPRDIIRGGLKLVSHHGQNAMDLPGKIPVSALHSFLYCPRLMYFQFVENTFVPSKDTEEGTAIHSRVNKPQEFDYPEDFLSDSSETIRSLLLSDDELGIHGVADLLKKSRDGSWIVCEYKHGAPYKNEDGLIPKAIDEFQVKAYILLARKNGMNVSGGSIYYAETRQVVAVPPPDNEQFLLDVLKDFKECALGKMPDPPDNANKCRFCSLYSACMPDESLYWRHQGKLAKSVRPPLAENRPDNTLVVVSPSAHVSKRGDTIAVLEDGKVVTSCPIHNLQTINVYGYAQLSTQVLHFCMNAGVAVSFFTSAGRFIGCLNTLQISGLDSRYGQYHIAENEEKSVKIAIRMIDAKIANQRKLLQRNVKQDCRQTLKDLKDLRAALPTAKTREEVMGIEGRAAALYFADFAKMLLKDELARTFEGRNRRPPRDPVNCLLSLGYSVLSSEIAGICQGIGLDAACGIMHAPRYGRPALALDLMEEFRPLIVDSVVLSLINRGSIDIADFSMLSNGCSLKKSGFQAFWTAYAMRMEEELIHPAFRYRVSYRHLLEVQARQLWRLFRGDAECYHPIITR